MPIVDKAFGEIVAVRLSDLDQLVELHLPLESFTCFGNERNCTCGIRSQTDTFGIKEHGGVGKVVWFTVESLLGALRYLFVNIKMHRTRCLIGRAVRRGYAYMRVASIIVTLDVLSVGTQGYSTIAPPWSLRDVGGGPGFATPVLRLSFAFPPFRLSFPFSLGSGM